MSVVSEMQKGTKNKSGNIGWASSIIIKAKDAISIIRINPKAIIPLAHAINEINATAKI